MNLKIVGLTVFVDSRRACHFSKGTSIPEFFHASYAFLFSGSVKMSLALDSLANL